MTHFFSILKFVINPLSFLDKISLFERNSIDTTDTRHSFSKLSIQSNDNKKSIESCTTVKMDDVDSLSSPNISTVLNKNSSSTIDEPYKEDILSSRITSENKINEEISRYKDIPENLYKSNINKHNFLQTQLSPENTGINLNENTDKESDKKENNDIIDLVETHDNSDISQSKIVEDSINVTDDVRLAESSSANTAKCDSDISLNEPVRVLEDTDKKDSIVIPPRLKKGNKGKNTKNIQNKNYPISLNPFSEDESEVNSFIDFFNP